MTLNQLQKYKWPINIIGVLALVFILLDLFEVSVFGKEIDSLGYSLMILYFICSTVYLSKLNKFKDEKIKELTVKLKKAHRKNRP